VITQLQLINIIIIIISSSSSISIISMTTDNNQLHEELTIDFKKLLRLY
jgi:hypothetical protein